LSGIVGIFDRKGAPVKRELLRALTHSLDYRGPDARETWAAGPFGFGHTMLRTANESLNERQPASLDGQYWITADARLDGRAELKTELEEKGRSVRHPAPDSDLILHAYAAWGEECVQHLRGDFAFAVWDSRKQLLFCGRDQFGIKPFYYAEPGDLFLFSNTLNCLRLHPDVSDELNEAAVADFLMFGLNCDAGTTTFRDIRRLPAAHFVTISADELRTKRYWTAPTDGRIRYRHADEYVEHFQVLLQSAVASRMHSCRTGIFLSGGLDSSAVAATARELRPGTAGPAALQAYTVTYESLLSDATGTQARTVAEFLRIPIQCLALDDLLLFDRWRDPEFACPEPVDDPFSAGLFDRFRMVASGDCRVAISGEGIDNLMHFQMSPYAADLARRREWKRLLVETARYLRIRPSPWGGVRRRIKNLFGRDAALPVFPQWLAPEHSRRTDAANRWKEFSKLSGPFNHPVHPQAHASLSIPQWSLLFEQEDPGVTHCPVEVRYPFLDLQIVNYLLALPPFPWFFEKLLLREAMAGRLPEKVRLRPKTPLQGDPLLKHLQRPSTNWLNNVRWSEELKQYIDVSALQPLGGERNSEQASLRIRPICFNFWLQSARRVRYNLQAEVSNG
jgi:asparagine synthase (glutamine-hydrolysing)